MTNDDTGDGVTDDEPLGDSLFGRFAELSVDAVEALREERQ